MDNQIKTRIVILRNLTIVLSCFTLILIIDAVSIPNILTLTLKIWIVAVSGCSFIGFILALFLARTDTTLILIFSLLSSFVSGLFFGISIFTINNAIRRNVASTSGNAE